MVSDEIGISLSKPVRSSSLIVVVENVAEFEALFTNRAIHEGC